MIISPRMLFSQMLFSQWLKSKWHFIGFNDRGVPVMNAICPECSKFQFDYQKMTPNPIVNIIGLPIHRLTDGKSAGVNFWINNCECGLVLWMCENFNWIRFLTEEQLIKTVVQEIGIGHEIIGDRLTIVPMNFDHKGKVVGSCLHREYTC